MKRVQISNSGYTAVVESATDDQLLSVEGGSCRIYTGETAPTEVLTGHLVDGGYQIVIPAGVGAWARAESDARVSIVVGMMTTVSAKVIGIGQTWKTVGRSKNTSYQNTSSKPIQQIIAHTNDSTGAVAVSSDNSTWVSIGQARIDGNGQTVCFIVPPGWYYKTEGTVNRWAELS